MPLYELLMLAKPSLPRGEMVALIKGLGDVVYRNGGFITQLKSFGDQHLAYDLRRPFEKYDQAHIWQMDFVARVEATKPLDHELHVNNSVLRWVLLKRPMSGKAAAPAAASSSAVVEP